MAEPCNLLTHRLVHTMDIMQDAGLKVDVAEPYAPLQGIRQHKAQSTLLALRAGHRLVQQQMQDGTVSEQSGSQLLCASSCTVLQLAAALQRLLPTV